ncbi:hypothetical protein BI364_08230 [Acidihalobacter yilgarnensis]|uniref:Uncharacterized protein n=1 Tax=Acidihalobacter yilgarnensis TaxID=2819280 RepID=A0A1D8IN98_9GAMM|nr:hypothetical protein BI364_08230 [Acidihalobacter yilgarnensis]
MNAPDRQGGVAPVPVHAGIGLHAESEREILLGSTAAAWLEAHSENYFGPGGGLCAICACWPSAIR